MLFFSNRILIGSENILDHGEELIVDFWVKGTSHVWEWNRHEERIGDILEVRKRPVTEEGILNENKYDWFLIWYEGNVNEKWM